MENTQQKPQEEEIDLLQLIQKIWKARKSILKVTVLFFIIGVLVALFSAKEYTATTLMIPQTADGKSAAGGLGGLAAMAGINLGGSSSESVPMTAYPKVVQSIPFKKKLVQTPLTFENISENISYKTYCEEYVKPSILDNIIKYTIGLPNLLFGSKEEQGSATDKDTELVQLSQKERSILNSIDSQLAITINEKEGTITLSYSVPEALPAAQMLQSAQNLLQESITEFKIQKAVEELDFIQKRYQEAEKDFKSKQFALAQFQDQNRNLFSSLPQTRLQQLQTDYNLAFSVYSELAKQLETKKIKVKEEQPIFTIIEPVSVPNERSKPKRAMIIAIWIFLGIVIGVVFVFAKDFIKQMKQSNNENAI